jgi:hypothetical protein
MSIRRGTNEAGHVVERVADLSKWVACTGVSLVFERRRLSTLVGMDWIPLEGIACLLFFGFGISGSCKKDRCTGGDRKQAGRQKLLACPVLTCRADAY